MPMVEIDEGARKILREWKDYYRIKGDKVDYSEAIRKINVEFIEEVFKSSLQQSASSKSQRLKKSVKRKSGKRS
jgi:hypothetical protein